MRHRSALLTAMFATTLLASGAVWAADPAKPEPGKITPQQAQVDRDYGKLSADGSAGFQDIMATRIAIFEGRIDVAKDLLKKAETSFDKARTDNTSYMKAEGDLKPGSTRAVATASANQAAPTSPATADQMKTPVAWLPVDGSIVINEDYTASPAKSAAVQDANKSIKTGDHKAAMDRLKLAGVNVDVLLSVVPMNKTIDALHTAAAQLDAGKYYEASQTLRQAENLERVDVKTIPAA